MGLRIKHKSNPFVAAKHKSVNPQEKHIKRPAAKVKSNKRSSFHSLGNKNFLSNPRPGQKPHKIRVSVKPKHQGRVGELNRIYLYLIIFVGLCTNYKNVVIPQIFQYPN